MASILLIDPHPRSQRSTARLLASEGYDVVLAGSAAAALVALCKREINLMLLDPALPDMPGAEFLDRLRDEPGWAECPVVIISPSSFDRVLWRTTGADLREWFVKGGFSADELIAAVQRHLPGRRMPSFN